MMHRNESVATTLSKVGIASTAALSFTAVLPSLALAYQPTTALGGFGTTTLQQRTGDAVTIVCGQLNSLGNSRTEVQQDLFDRCGSMVGNANQLEGIDAGPLAKSLGLDADALASAVQTVANEEIASTRTMSNDIASAQLNSGIGRLNALRAGAGFSIAGMGFDGATAIAGLDSWSRGATGGGASADMAAKWGFFVNGYFGTGDRDGTEREDAFDYDRSGFTAGADYRLGDNLILGGLVSYLSIDSDFDTTAAVPGGGIDAESWGVGLYATYYQDDWYVDGLLGYNQTDYDIDRRILLPLGDDPGSLAEAANRTANGKTDSKDWTISVGAGADFNRQSLTFGPFARLNYNSSDLNGYRESGAYGLNLTVADQDWESLTSVLGARISMALSQQWGVLVPQARVAWVHEFRNDADAFTAFYTADPRRNQLIALSDDPDTDYFTLGLGISAVLPNNIQAYLDYQTLIDHRYVNDNLVSLGLRAAF